MKEEKLRLSGRRFQSAKQSDIRPYTHRVHRDHGGGLWTFEGNDGQLYLAVKSKAWTEEVRERRLQKQASGDAYR